MKKASEKAIEKLFDGYLESDLAKLSDLDREQQDTFNSYYDGMKAGKADPEDLTDVQYMALKAGFYAGFRKAEELGAKSKAK